MELKYNLTGADRKRLVKAISEIITLEMISIRPLLTAKPFVRLRRSESVEP